MIPARALVVGVLLLVLAGSLSALAQRPGSTGRGSTRKTALPAPPKAWKEHWFEHEQEVRLVASDAEVAVYYDDKMPATEKTAWIFPFMSRAWRYTKATYGNFGPPERLFAIFHEGRYGGGHPSTYFDKSHDHRNVTDCGTGAWNLTDIDLPSHEIGHIVEGANNGVHESPAFGIWHDSKWIELYQYDLYLGLGLQADAERVFAKFSAQADDFPRPGSHWFRDFFYPAYRDHGRTKLMVTFFRLLAKHFPQEPEDGGGVKYARPMNWGEFLHFMSAAAGRDLRPLARRAFGFPAEWNDQFRRARAEFPALTYKP